MEKTTNSFTEDELRQAVSQVFERYLAHIPEPEEFPEHKFSPAHEEKMSRLIKRVYRQSKRRSALRRIAAVFAAVILGLGAWLALDTEARADAINWIKETFGSVIVYRLPVASGAEDMPDYALGWMPDGFELEDSIESTVCSYFYKSENEELCFSFTMFSTDETQAQLFAEPGQPVETVYINGAAADFYPVYGSSGACNLSWYDEETGAILSLDSNLSREIMIIIAENVYIKEK